jgi:hypothetical protein
LTATSSAPAVGFVVSEIGYEYNDEHYYTPESEGVTPQEIFFDKAKADAHCREQNVAAFRKIFGGQTRTSGGYTWRSCSTLGEYGYEPLAVFDKGRVGDAEDARDRLAAIFGLSYEEVGDPDEFTIPKGATDDQISRLIDITTIRFYSVHEVPVTA